MLLTEGEIKLLHDAVQSIKACPGHKSPECYEIFSLYVQHIYHKHGYYKYPKDVQETAELAAIQKAYKAAAAYDADRGTVARGARGYKPDPDKALCRFFEVVLTRSIWTSFDIINQKQIPANKGFALSSIVTDGEYDFEIADLNNMSELEDRIDEESRQKRQRDFERRLDLIERGMR